MDGGEGKAPCCPEELSSLSGGPLSATRASKLLLLPRMSPPHTQSHTWTYTHVHARCHHMHVPPVHICTVTCAPSSEHRDPQRAEVLKWKPPHRSPHPPHLLPPSHADSPPPRRLPTEHEEAQTPRISSWITLPCQRSSRLGQMLPLCTVSCVFPAPCQAGLGVSIWGRQTL